MEQVTAALRHWLAKNNLAIEGVKIILEFPNKHEMYRAEACIRRVYGAPVMSINGIQLTLASRVVTDV